MDDERRRAIMDEAYANLDRLAEAERQRAFEQWQRGPVDDVDGRQDDPLVQWAASMPPKPKAAAVAVRNEEAVVVRDQSMSSEQQAKWDSWCKAHIELALQKLRHEIVNAVGKVVAKERNNRRDELLEALGALKARVQALELGEQKGEAEVVDMRGVLRKRQAG
jgi:hypothetical protein